MDIQFQNGGRNGIEGEYFNFLPVIAGAFAAKAVINKGKAKKYKSKELQSIQAEYPWGETTSEHDRVILKLKAVKDAKEREVALAKNKTQKKFRQSELDAINAYLTDANAYRKELSAAEKADAISEKGTGVVGSNTIEGPQVEVVKLTPESELTGQNAAAPASGYKNKLLLFGGIGLGALILILLLTRKNK